VDLLEHGVPLLQAVQDGDLDHRELDGGHLAAAARRTSSSSVSSCPSVFASSCCWYLRRRSASSARSFFPAASCARAISCSRSSTCWICRARREHTSAGVGASPARTCFWYRFRLSRCSFRLRPARPSARRARVAGGGRLYRLEDGLVLRRDLGDGLAAAHCSKALRCVPKGVVVDGRERKCGVTDCAIAVYRVPIREDALLL
jgi:hypothetical protein